MKAQLLLLFLALVAGAIMPLQAGLSVQLGKSVQQPIFAAFVSFLVGTVVLLIYLILVKFDFSSLTNTKGLSPFVWTAGILGAFYVTAVIVLAPKLGSALTFSLIVVGQIVVSLIFDHYGLLGMPMKSINWQKILGVSFLITGLFILKRF